jgi:heme A synthase
MKNRVAILLAILCLVVILLGAYLTSETRPMPGTDAASAAASAVTAPSLEQAHRIAGYALAVCTVGLAIWVANIAGWIALAAVLAEAFSGNFPVVHALTAPALFASIVAVAVVTSASWQAAPRPVPSGWNPLRTLGMLVPVLIVMQVGLGAAFRHMIVLAIILVAGVFVVRQHPDHPSLKPAALALLIIAGVQVLLGFAVYLVLLMSQENNVGLVVTGVLHVMNGALTLAASVVLAMQMRRHLIQSSGAK